MFERRISPEDVRLVLGFSGSRPIHVVAADNPVEHEAIVITAYEPETTQWDSTFRKRKVQ